MAELKSTGAKALAVLRHPMIVKMSMLISTAGDITGRVGCIRKTTESGRITLRVFHTGCWDSL